MLGGRGGGMSDVRVYSVRIHRLGLTVCFSNRNMHRFVVPFSCSESSGSVMHVCRLDQSWSIHMCIHHTALTLTDSGPHSLRYVHQSPPPCLFIIVPRYLPSALTCIGRRVTLASHPARSILKRDCFAIVPPLVRRDAKNKSPALKKSQKC